MEIGGANERKGRVDGGRVDGTRRRDGGRKGRRDRRGRGKGVDGTEGVREGVRTEGCIPGDRVRDEPMGSRCDGDGGLKLRRRGRAEGISVRITQGICGDGPLLRDVVERKETITNSAVYNLLFALPTLPGLLYSHGGGRKPWQGTTRSPSTGAETRAARKARCGRSMRDEIEMQ